MSDNLTASLSVGVIYSGDGSGLTPEQEEQLNKIPEMEASINNINESLNTKANTSDIPTNTSELYNDSGFLTSIPSEYVTEQEMNEAIANVSSGGNVDLSGYATKDELNAKANISDIPTAIETYVTAHRDELKGETGSAGKDGVTPIFKIGNTATLDAGSLATVSIKKSPTTEEYTFDFGIPKGADGTTGSGSTTDLTDYQKKIDSTLTTTNKTVVGAINELKTEIGDSNSGLAKDVADLKVNLNTVSTILDNINGEVI